MNDTTKDPVAIVLARGINALGIVRSLYLQNVRSIIITDSPNDPALLSKIPWKKIVIKNLNSERLIEGLTPFFHKGYVLFGASDYFISLISENKSSLQAHFKILIPDGQLIESLIDKRKELKMIQETGIPLPSSIAQLPDNPEHIEEALKFPLIIKPRLNIYMAIIDSKNKIINNRNQLNQFYTDYYDHRDKFVIQEIIPGDDSTLWVCNCFFNEHHDLQQSFVFQRLGTSPSHYGVTSFAISKENPPIIAYVKKLGKQLGYTGPAMIEFKYDFRDESYKYIEINPRIGMCNFFDTQCGINNVYATYAYLCGKEPLDISLNQENNRVFIDFYSDFVSRLKSNESFGEIIERYSKYARYPRTYAIWWKNDPLPILSTSRNFLRLIYYLTLRKIVKLFSSGQ